MLFIASHSSAGEIEDPTPWKSSFQVAFSERIIAVQFILWHTPQTVVARFQYWRTRRPLFCHQKDKQCMELSEYSENGVSVTYQCKFMVSGNKKGPPTILVTLIAHHTSTLTSCNGSSWINTGFSADQQLLVCEFTYQLGRKRSFIAKQKECDVGSISAPRVWWLLIARAVAGSLKQPNSTWCYSRHEVTSDMGHINEGPGISLYNQAAKWLRHSLTEPASG
jgi:hypothetical protein